MDCLEILHYHRGISEKMHYTSFNWAITLHCLFSKLSPLVNFCSDYSTKSAQIAYFLSAALLKIIKWIVIKWIEGIKANVKCTGTLLALDCLLLHHIYSCLESYFKVLKESGCNIN